MRKKWIEDDLHQCFYRYNPSRFGEQIATDFFKDISKRHRAIGDNLRATGNVLVGTKKTGDVGGVVRSVGVLIYGLHQAGVLEIEYKIRRDRTCEKAQNITSPTCD